MPPARVCRVFSTLFPWFKKEVNAEIKREGIEGRILIYVVQTRFPGSKKRDESWNKAGRY